MKKFLTLMFSFILSFSIPAQNIFLPGPNPNLQTLPAGSYVIPMGNTLQSNTAGYFNLKTYGLICHLLNNNVKLKWVIRAGKAKDGIDFSALAEKIQPVFTAGSTRDFKAGPFVIYAADTTGVAALVNSFYTNNSLTGNDRPSVYRLTAPALNVDIRHDMDLFRPKVAILNDGGQTAIHVTYMTLCSVPAANYVVGVPGLDLLTNCYSFASEPHNDNSNSATIWAIRKFVEYGGNFLAQCAAIGNYENNANGHFQTTLGINITNTGVTNATGIYPNPDLTYSQFEGIFSFERGGTVNNWLLAAGSSFTNNQHNHGSGGIMAAQSPIGASVSKLTNPAISGGMVFYLGGHSFTDINKIDEINGIRMYMNAMLTPNAINLNCNTGDTLPNPLPAKLISFNANLNQDQSKVNLTWTTASEINTSHFVVERSTDGEHFIDTGIVFAKGNEATTTHYSFPDDISPVTPGIIYYRLRSVDIDGKSEYSETRIIRFSKQAENNIKIVAYPNPVTNELRVTIPSAWQNKKVTYELFGVNGQAAGKKINSHSSQTETLNVNNLAPGLYIVRVSCQGETAQQKIIKK